MSSFDPMGVAIDWLDAYRTASLSIVDLYADDGALECSCDGATILYGRAAIMEYWRKRLVESPAGELTDLKTQGGNVVISYRVPAGIVRAVLQFDSSGKIESSRCGQATG